MVFGWFSKKPPPQKAMERADKLFRQGRWAEALANYEEAASDPALADRALAQARACREQLVELNLEEARALSRAEEPDRAREHAELALQLAGDETDLADRARKLLEDLSRGAPKSRPAAAAAAPACAGCSPVAEPPSEPLGGEPEDLFAFYLETLTPAERRILEPLGGTFPEAFVRLQQGDADGASVLLEQAAGEHPGAAGVEYALGLLALLRQEWAEAEARFRTVLGQVPDLDAAASHRAEALREAGKAEEARAAMEAHLEARPEHGEGWTLLAALCLEAGDAEGALAAAERAARVLEEGRVEPLLLKASALEAMDRVDEALQTLQGAAARAPNRVEVLAPIGRLLLRKGGPSAERAAEVYRRCAALDPERGWWYLLRVAEAYIARGWKGEAREVLGQVAPGLPEDAEARAEWERLRKAV